MLQAVCQVDDNADDCPDTEAEPRQLRKLPHQPRQAIVPRIGTIGMNGRRNGLGWSGLVYRSMITPMHTRTNAKNVPIFVMSAASPMGMNAARIATAMPVRMVARCGVPKRG